MTRDLLLMHTYYRGVGRLALCLSLHMALSQSPPQLALFLSLSLISRSPPSPSPPQSPLQPPALCCSLIQSLCITCPLSPCPFCPSWTVQPSLFAPRTGSLVSSVCHPFIQPAGGGSGAEYQHVCFLTACSDSQRGQFAGQHDAGTGVCVWVWVWGRGVCVNDTSVLLLCVFRVKRRRD